MVWKDCVAMKMNVHFIFVTTSYIFTLMRVFFVMISKTAGYWAIMYFLYTYSYWFVFSHKYIFNFLIIKVSYESQQKWYVLLKITKGWVFFAKWAMFVARVMKIKDFIMLLKILSFKQKPCLWVVCPSNRIFHLTTNRSNLGNE